MVTPGVRELIGKRNLGCFQGTSNSSEKGFSLGWGWGEKVWGCDDELLFLFLLLLPLLVLVLVPLLHH